jgi:hypothetical protein
VPPSNTLFFLNPLYSWLSDSSDFKEIVNLDKYQLLAKMDIESSGNASSAAKDVYQMHYTMLDDFEKTELSVSES